MAEVKPHAIPVQQLTVHLPPDVFRNLESRQKVERSLFDLMGCGNCNSGLHIDWRHLQEFVVNENLEVVPVSVRPSTTQVEAGGLHA